MTPDKWYMSKRLWASVLSLVAAGLTVFGIAISDAEQQAIIDALDKFIPAAAALISALLAVWSKIQEARKIKNQQTEGK